MWCTLEIELLPMLHSAVIFRRNTHVFFKCICKTKFHTSPKTVTHETVIREKKETRTAIDFFTVQAAKARYTLTFVRVSEVDTSPTMLARLGQTTSYRKMSYSCLSNFVLENV